MVNSAGSLMRFFLQARCVPVRTIGMMCSSLFALLYLQDSEWHFHMHQKVKNAGHQDQNFIKYHPKFSEDSVQLQIVRMMNLCLLERKKPSSLDLVPSGIKMSDKYF